MSTFDDVARASRVRRVFPVEVLSKAAKIIVAGGDSELQRDVIDNISSTRAATATANHHRLFYPACGSDVLRAFLAFDATEVVAADSDLDELGRAARQFINLFHVKPLAVDNDQRFSFHLDGRRRTVTLRLGDARRVENPFGSNKIDVFLAFNPAAANDRTPTAEGIDQNLGWSSYQAVSDGGLLCYSETSVQTPPPNKALYEIAGLKELEFTPRPPATLLTGISMAATTESQPGFVYQKLHTVDKSLLAEVKKAIETGFYVAEGCRDPTVYMPEGFDVFRAENRQAFREHADAFRTLGVLDSFVSAYERDAISVLDGLAKTYLSSGPERP